MSTRRAGWVLALGAVAAALSFPAAATAKPLSFVLDLGARRLDGVALLGMDEGQVVRRFGKPTWRTGGSDPVTRLGYERPGLGWLQIGLAAPDPARPRYRRVWFFVVGGLRVRDTRLGPLHQGDPQPYQAQIEQAYADAYRLVSPYGCDPTGVCSTVFRSLDGRYRLGIGDGDRGLFVNVARWPPPR